MWRLRRHTHSACEGFSTTITPPASFETARDLPGKQVAAVAQGPCRLVEGGGHSPSAAAPLDVPHRHKHLGSSAGGQLRVALAPHGPAAPGNNNNKSNR